MLEHDCDHLCVQVVYGQVQGHEVMCVLDCDVSTLVQQELHSLHMTTGTGVM